MDNFIKKKIKELPKSPGVYFFKNKSNKILYIGKASSIKDRVRSYFTNNLNEVRSPWLVHMLPDIYYIDFEKTDSALEALLLEARLIKKHQPIFNSKEKDDKSFNYVVITKEKFPVIRLIREKDLFNKKESISTLHIFGPFPHSRLLKEALYIVRRIFPFRDEKCIPAKEKGNLYSKPCFSRQIKLCPGVCTGEISSTDYKRTVGYIRLFFQGYKKEIIKRLEKDRDLFSKKRMFEKAGEVQKKIQTLEHIRDISLLNDPAFENINEDYFKEKKDKNFRVEGYDIAHISGSFVVGVFSVIEGGYVKKSDYRKFRIKENPAIDDTASLRELIQRRIKHSEWRLPDLIVVDGGVAQKNVAISVLSEFKKEIPVVAVTKDKNHRPYSYLGNKKLIGRYKDEIILSNMEAHRFVLSYHKKLREKIDM